MRQAQSGQVKFARHIALLFFILIFGFFLRSQEALSHNAVFLKDQGRDLLDVRSIVVDKKLSLIGPYTGLQGVFQGPLYYYLLSIPFALFKGDPTGVLYLFVGASMAAILIGYAIGRRLFSPSAGLLIACMYAVSPAAAAASSFIWSPFLLIPAASAYLYFFLLWVRFGYLKYYLGMWICLGLLFHFEIAFAAPFTLATIVIIAMIARKKHYTVSYIYPACCLFLSLSPLILFDFRHDHLTIRSLIHLFSGATQGLAASHEPFGKIVVDHMVTFVSNVNASFVSEHSWQGYVSFGMAFFALAYIVFGKLPEVKVLLVYPLILFMIYVLYPFQLWGWYVIGLFPIYFVLMGVLLDKLKTSAIGNILTIVVLGFIFYNASSRLTKLYAQPDDGGTAKIRGKVAAIDALYQDAQGKPFSAFVFTPVVLTDAYDYLFWWHGQRTYGYVPANKKEGVFYLLIEPDPSKPWSYNGWLETVIKIGDILYTKTLPSGFIIQKRYAKTS